MSPDQTLMTLLPPMEKCSKDFYQRIVFTAQIWVVSTPLCKRDKEIGEIGALICSMKFLSPKVALFW